MVVFAFSLILVLCLAKVGADGSDVPRKPNDDMGKWGDLFDMEVIAIHSMQLPDGQILAYGADYNAAQGGQVYEIWDVRPATHTLTENHKLVYYQDKVNIFCSTASFDNTTGNILIMGGDDDSNNGIADVLELNTQTLEVRKHPMGDMHYPRWYASSVVLPDGRIFVVGGSAKNGALERSAIPEVWSPTEGFRELPGATVPAISNPVLGLVNNAWYYPHTFVNSRGELIITVSGLLSGFKQLPQEYLQYLQSAPVYKVDVDGGFFGRGTIKRIGTKPFSSHHLGPAIMYDVDLVVMLDNAGWLWRADLSGSTPDFDKLIDTGYIRTDGAMALLPDGRVTISGGCTNNEKGNELESAVYNVQIWDPKTNTIYDGPDQTIARLYHSSTLILPDGSIFSAGGGAPGPLKNLNGQIYMPGYLFDPETGELATRPAITEWPKNVQAGTTIEIKVDVSPEWITRVTTTKPGFMTHARNNEARFIELSFSVKENNMLSVWIPEVNVMLPGLWNLNVIDVHGVPSEAALYGVNMAPLPI